MARFVTLDLGTTYFKACMFDDQGGLLHTARVPLDPQRPKPGHCELPGDLFEKRVTAVMGKLRAMDGHGFEGVAGVSFATQTNSVQLFDGANQPLTPLVIWTDERVTGIDADLAKLVADQNHIARTGLVRLGPRFTTARLLHWSRTLPQWRDVRHVRLIGDVLTHWWTGHDVTEVGYSGLTGLMDIHERAWITPMFERIGIDPGVMPTIAFAGTDLGMIRREVAEKLGLPRDCRFAVGCLDQYTGAIGAGNLTPGVISETTGTVLATVRCADVFDPNPAPDIFQGPAYKPGLYYQMAFGSVSANLLEAYRNSLPDRPEFEDLDAMAAQVPIGSNGVRLVENPDPMHPEGFFVDQAADEGEATRAILEAVAYALDTQVRSLCGDTRPRVIHACGGAARSEVWRQVKADILGFAVVPTTCEEPTSLGAAMLAAMPIFGQTLPTLAATWVRYLPPTQPNHARHLLYRELIEQEA